MKKLIILVAITATLAACEDPFGATQRSGQTTADTASDVAGTVDDDLPGDRDQDRDQTGGGNN